MPTYEISAPDGKTYQIDGPAGATPDQVRQKVLEAHPEAATAPKPSWLEAHGRDLATGAGAIGGAVLAAPAAAAASVPTLGLGGLAAEAGGAGLGAGIGGQLYDLGKRFLGKPDTQTGPERIAAALSDVGGGAASVPAGKIIGAAAAPVAKGGGQLLAHILGATTGTGAEAVTQAASAGFKGGDAGQAFQQALRGEVPVQDVVPVAKKALANMYQQRALDYQTNIKPVSDDPTVLNFDGIEKAVQEVKNRGTYKGQDINKKAADAWNDINAEVQNWKKLDPKEFHTPEGLDALKRSIGDIAQNLPYGTPARTAADTVYNAVKSEISAQAPDYAKAMADYQSATENLRDVQNALQLKNSSSAIASLKRLQSTMKDTAGSGFGAAKGFAEQLAANGAPTLLPSMAGQQLNAVLPRGMAGAVEGTSAGLGALLSGGHLPVGAIAAAPVASPRLVGEGAYYSGKGAAALAKILGGTPKGPVTQAQALLLAKALQYQKPTLGDTQ